MSVLGFLGLALFWFIFSMIDMVLSVGAGYHHQVVLLTPWDRYEKHIKDKQRNLELAAKRRKRGDLKEEQYHLELAEKADKLAKVELAECQRRDAIEAAESRKRRAAWVAKWKRRLRLGGGDSEQIGTSDGDVGRGGAR